MCRWPLDGLLELHKPTNLSSARRCPRSGRLDVLNSGTNEAPTNSAVITAKTRVAECCIPSLLVQDVDLLSGRQAVAIESPGDRVQKTRTKQLVFLILPAPSPGRRVGRGRNLKTSPSLLRDIVALADPACWDCYCFLFSFVNCFPTQLLASF